MSEGNFRHLQAAADEIRAAADPLSGALKLADIAAKAATGQLDRQTLLRELIDLFEGSDLAARLHHLPPDVRALISAFRAGHTPHLKDFHLPSNPATATVRAALKAAQPCPDIKEGDGSPMKCVPGAQFQNWGRTVENTPANTYIPRTITGVCNLVQWAAAHGKRVRAAGYRHTWGELYSQDDQILVSLLPLDVVEDLPSPEPPIDPSDQLQGIKIVGTVQEGGVRKALCRIGSATTNEQFRRWCLDDQGGAWNWTLPLNVIMVEITFGGSNGPICHGAGIRNRTLSDLVASIEFVNPLGQVQTVSDPAQLTAAAGCFGLLGIVTAVTLKLDPMSYASMRPSKKRVGLTIPPPAGYAVPAQIDMSGITQQQLAQALQDFEKQCAQCYYAEWFWFPFQTQCWINTWNNDGSQSDATDYPPPLEVFLQWLEEYLAECLNNWGPFQSLPDWVQAGFLGFAAMSQLPDIAPTDPPIVTYLIDALHFRRGIQNMRVLDMELEIPIPASATDPSKPDWSVCQRAWWDALTVFYSRSDTPMRIALEMRVMGGSNVTMAPQYGNSFGTCSIEVLTNLNTPQDEWLSYMQQITDKWTSYTDSHGAKLNVRPHWAKQWKDLTFFGQPVEQYLASQAYKDRLPEFGNTLAAIASAGGYTLATLKQRFSNPLLDTIFQSIFEAPVARHAAAPANPK
jgi:hypothetical protein